MVKRLRLLAAQRGRAAAAAAARAKAEEAGPEVKAEREEQLVPLPRSAPSPPPSTFGAEIVGRVLDVTYEDAPGVYRVCVTKFNRSNGWHRVRSHGAQGLWDGEEYTDVIDVNEMYAKGNVRFVTQQKVHGRHGGRGRRGHAGAADGVWSEEAESLGEGGSAAPASSSSSRQVATLAAAAITDAPSREDAGASSGASSQGDPPDLAACTELVGITCSAVPSPRQRRNLKQRGRKLLARKPQKAVAAKEEPKSALAQAADSGTASREETALVLPPLPDDEPAEKVVFGADLCGHVVEIVHRNVEYVVRVINFNAKTRKHFVSSFGLDVKAEEAFGGREVDLNRLFALGRLSLAGRSEPGPQPDCVESPRGRGGRFSEYMHTSSHEELSEIPQASEEKAIVVRNPASRRGRGDTRTVPRSHAAVGGASVVGPASSPDVVTPQRPAASSAALGTGSLRP